MHSVWNIKKSDEKHLFNFLSGTPSPDYGSLGGEAMVRLNDLHPVWRRAQNAKFLIFDLANVSLLSRFDGNSRLKKCVLGISILKRKKKLRAK